MTVTADSPPLLDAEHAAFIESGVSITAASRNPANQPSIARMHGCRVAADRRRVRVFCAVAHAGALLDDVRRSGVVAVVFSLPSTHRTIQLKARDAVVRTLAAGEAERIGRYVSAFVADVCPLGYDERVMRTLFSCLDAKFVAVEFTPTAAFVQTPGPGAGAPLKR